VSPRPRPASAADLRALLGAAWAGGRPAEPAAAPG